MIKPIKSKVPVDLGGLEGKIPQRYLSTQVAAAFLGISSNALRIRVFRNQIRAFKDEISGELRFSDVDIASVLQPKEI